MIKNLALSAALVSLLCPALRAGTLEDAFAAGSAAARKVPASLCSQNKELEKEVFRFKLDGADGGDSMDVRFAFSGCSVSDTGERTPSAVRMYKGDYAGYTLVLETKEGDDQTLLALTQDSTVAGYLGSFSKEAILKLTLELNPTVSDFRVKGKNLAGKATFSVYKPAAAAEADLCLQNQELDKMDFRFKLDGEKGSDSMDVRFSFVSCRVTDRWYDDHGATPRAIRVYKGDFGDYELWLDTMEDSTDTSVSLHQDFVASAYLSYWPTQDLLNKRIDFASVKVDDLRTKGKRLTGSAFLLCYDPNPSDVYPDGPTGCQ